MPDETSDLNYWLNKLKNAGTPDEIFRILDQFRPLEWTDLQRSNVAKLYIRCLELMRNNGKSPVAKTGAIKTGAIEEEEDVALLEEGPVWYEKI